MRYTNLLTCVMALALGAQEALGVDHGEISELDGSNFRWHEVAKGFFRGVPEDKWDDSLHKRSEVQLDIDEIRGLTARRMSRAICPSKAMTFQTLAGPAPAAPTAGYFSNGTPKQDLFDFLNSPWVSATAGIGIAGVMSGQINEATKKECSTGTSGNSQADMIRAAIEAASAANPDAEELSVDIAGPSGTVNIRIKAGPANTTPPLTCPGA